MCTSRGCAICVHLFCHIDTVCLNRFAHILDSYQNNNQIYNLINTFHLIKWYHCMTKDPFPERRKWSFYSYHSILYTTPYTHTGKIRKNHTSNPFKYSVSFCDMNVQGVSLCSNGKSHCKSCISLPGNMKFPVRLSQKNSLQWSDSDPIWML